jgi:hypothetical protein
VSCCEVKLLRLPGCCSDELKTGGLLRLDWARPGCCSDDD